MLSLSVTELPQNDIYNLLLILFLVLQCWNSLVYILNEFRNGIVTLNWEEMQLGLWSQTSSELNREAQYYKLK